MAVADLKVGGGSAPAPALPATEASSARAAQRAFFEAALTKTSATSAPTTLAAADRQAPQVRRTVAPEASQPGKLLRPGSLLDIKV